MTRVKKSMRKPAPSTTPEKDYDGRNDRRGNFSGLVRNWKEERTIREKEQVDVTRWRCSDSKVEPPCCWSKHTLKVV